MKKSVGSIILLFAFLMILVMSGCAPASTPAPTHLPSTFTPSPIPPTNTPEPTATNTPEPTATPILLPDTLNSTFSNVSIVHRESFEYGDVINGALPNGWECEEQFAAWITKGSQLQIQPSNFGTVFWFSKEKITPNTGIYFTFKYNGSQENFTLGFDNVNANGERIKGTDFRSVAMEVRSETPIVYGNFGGATAKGSFKGNLRLLEDTWYNIALAFDENQNYIIKVWQPKTPEQEITYFRKWDDFPDEYYFISWINAKRRLLIDDFTVFKFEEIVQN